MRDSNGPGEIYIVQTPHCMHLHTSVFKTGRAFDSIDRLRGYPKGTKLLCCLPVSRMRDAEGAMLGSCRGDADVIERRDFGSEYFEGDLGHLMNKLITVSRLFSWTFRETSPDETAGDSDSEDPCPSASASALDATVLLGEFVRANAVELATCPVDSAILLDRVIKMYRDAGCTRRASPTLKALAHDLQKYFGAEEIVSHKFPDNVCRHAIRFRRPTTQPQPQPRPQVPQSKSIQETVRDRPIRFFESFAMTSKKQPPPSHHSHARADPVIYTQYGIRSAAATQPFVRPPCTATS